jgi:hypothetical protein
MKEFLIGGLVAWTGYWIGYAHALLRCTRELQRLHDHDDAG